MTPYELEQLDDDPRVGDVGQVLEKDRRKRDIVLRILRGQFTDDSDGRRDDS
jgi:hypothetical protein